jgi:hypothetical protein
MALDPTSSINPFLEAVIDPAISKDKDIFRGSSFETLFVGAALDRALSSLLRNGGIAINQLCCSVC